MEQAIIKCDSGQEITLTAEDIKNTLCPSADEKETRMFLELCKAQRLNPFIKEAYLVKYGNAPATIITGKEVFTKRAQAHPKFRGMECGISLLRNNQLERRAGSMVLDGERLVGGWCKVYVEGYAAPVFDEVSIAEYSTGKSGWAKMPATMIRKVAMVHALREAFPESFQGLYCAEEMAQSEPAPQVAKEASDTALKMRNDMAKEFAEMRGRSVTEVLSALESVDVVQAAKTAGDYETADKVGKEILVLNAWIAKAKDAAPVVEPEPEVEDAQVVEVEIAAEDLGF